MAADAETKAEAVAAARRGISHAEIAKVAGVRARTIGRWLTEANAAPAPKHMQALAPEREPIPPRTLPDDTLEMMRTMLADTIGQADAAKADGNHTVAQRSMASAAALVNTITRLEKNVADNADELRISRAEIDDAREMVRARLEALAERPILCTDCGKKLSISYGDPPKGKDT